MMAELIVFHRARSRLDCIDVVRVYPEKLDDQLTIAHRPLTHPTGRAQWVYVCLRCPSFWAWVFEGI
jgi:hypothetical protein